jgi:hypothetical protein
MFMCSSKSCIPQRYKCDGTPDCGDGADESREICGKSSIKKVKKKNNNLNLITRIFPRRIAM